MSQLKVIPSAHPFSETVNRVEQRLADLGVPVFARIDHEDNARSAGLEMPPTIVLVFGAARGGTPVMNARPDVAYELPLRLLVRQNDEVVELVYRPIDDLVAAYDIPADLAAPLHLIDKVATAAAAFD